MIADASQLEKITRTRSLSRPVPCRPNHTERNCTLYIKSLHVTPLSYQPPSPQTATPSA
ncbi:hypothetical protein BGZ61DRAFT_461302 [Ilyonectria robusta]|uniref:uncharacterized protein n=1 Tax=Ilyonectria robusta TaxID=1079257 RepID=UPI001E8CBD37|nr:uncharacterized protein BGZ61DRAFT_461302 [Ilyonectria robusta]KAH8667149.1 hypothetical protein BGZ61DRAFT_461302 [Ilyonectria robusta]